MINRPLPPGELIERYSRPFEAAPLVEAWLRASFIDPGAPLFNPDHEHLQSATIGVLWTTVQRVHHMRAVAGQAERPTFQGNTWTRARQEQQVIEWFGLVPDFILTFDANVAMLCDDRQWCALVEHELYHCGQAKNAFGGPKFHKDGMPVFGIRGHDVEEFSGVVARYGPTAAVAELVSAIGTARIQDKPIEAACGTCRALV